MLIKENKIEFPDEYNKELERLGATEELKTLFKIWTNVEKEYDFTNKLLSHLDEDKIWMEEDVENAINKILLEIPELKEIIEVFIPKLDSKLEKKYITIILRVTRNGFAHSISDLEKSRDTFPDNIYTNWSSTFKWCIYSINNLLEYYTKPFYYLSDFKSDYSRLVIVYMRIAQQTKEFEKTGTVKTFPKLVRELKYMIDGIQEKKKKYKPLFEKETEYFKENFDNLYRDYKGKFVAILNNRIVGTDKDPISLAKKVYSDYGYRPIYVQMVQKRKRQVRISSPRVLGRRG